jgi:hypothetical protein
MIRSRFEPVISRYCYTIPFVAAPLDMKVRSLQLTYRSQSSLQQQLSMYRHQTQSTQWGCTAGWPYTPMLHSRYFPFRKEKHLLCAMLFVCLFPWASAASHGCTAACWIIVPPALDLPTLATRCPRAYRRLPHSSGGRWNLRAGNRTGNIA